ncbi:hypothetical protein [Nocardia carnea]|uniref:hypothetical protein n=1 Tax=Nocardia carnea TaxID=37328 RepID=UPI002458D637|nr:hypothetical protein [Nocardia carnea]
MIEVGDIVRITEHGVSRFVVLEVDPDEGRAVIEAEDETIASRYPFSMPLSALRKVD